MYFFLILFSGQIYFKKKKTGGISFNSTLTLTHVDEKLCYQILHEYKIHNAEVCIFLPCVDQESKLYVVTTNNDSFTGHTQLE